jgi:hypothetical protein
MRPCGAKLREGEYHHWVTNAAIGCHVVCGSKHMPSYSPSVRLIRRGSNSKSPINRKSTADKKVKGLLDRRSKICV